MKSLILKAIFHSIILQKLFLKYLIKPKKKNNGTKRFMISVESDDRYFFLKNTTFLEETNIEFLDLPTIFFQNLYKHYLGKHRTKKPKHNCDIHNKNDLAFKKDLNKYHKNIIKLLLFMKKEFQPDAFISASLGDSRWREFIKLSSKTTGIPWVVTEREGVIAPIVNKQNPPYVIEEFKPDCDLMTISNTKHYSYWKGIGISEKKLRLTGELKTDFWHKEINSSSELSKVLDPNKMTVLYFAFGKTNYVNRIYFPNLSGDWEYIQDEHFEVLSKLVKSNSNIQIVIKDGHSNDISNKIHDYKDHLEKKEFILLGPKFKAIDLIKESSLIIGLQTTALIESMFTDKPIIYAGWGDFHEEVYPELLQLRDGDTITTKSKEDFFTKADSVIKSNFHYPVNQIKRKEFREQYFHKPDGSTHKRVLEEILNYLKSR